MSSNSHNYVNEALTMILDWNISDELLPLMLIDQAKLLAGFDAEEPYQDVDDGWQLAPESYVAFQ